MTGKPRLRGVLLVCGGRHYTDAGRVRDALDRAASRLDIEAVRHGACRTGADQLADRWARARGYAVDPMPADWSRGLSGGPKRNAAMLAKGGVVAAVAFPGGDGTANMVARCKAAGVPVWEVPR